MHNSHVLHRVLGGPFNVTSRAASSHVLEGDILRLMEFIIHFMHNLLLRWRMNHIFLLCILAT